MYKVDALVIVNKNNKTKAYNEYLEKCFDTLTENKINIVVGEYVQGSITCARKDALSKSKAPFSCIIDNDDYIGNDYVNKMLETYTDNVIVYPTEYLDNNNVITPSRTVNLKFTVNNIQKYPALAHHHFSSRNTFKKIYNSINIKTLQDTRIFNKQAIQLGFTYKQSTAEYYWRIHNDQTTRSIDFRREYMLNKDKYDV